MRETLSKRPRVTAKVTAKNVKTKVEADRAKEKLRPATASKTASVSKTSARTSVAKTRNAANKTSKSMKSVKKVAGAKKTVAKVVKPAAKKTATTQPVTKQVEVAAKTKSAKVQETRTKAKAPVQTTASVKPNLVKSAVPAQVGRNTIRSKRKAVLPLPVAPSPEVPRRSVTSGGLRAFEHAVKVFNRRHFEEAKSLFENLLSKFSTEGELIARSRMYIQVCSQKLAQAQITPHNADELYDHGVYALNIGDFSQAKTFFEKALRLKPDEAHLLYSLAATHAQTGAMDQALEYLKRTIQVQPRYRIQALNDSDFSGLRENRQFLELLGLASPFDLLQSRR